MRQAWNFAMFKTRHHLHWVVQVRVKPRLSGLMSLTMERLCWDVIDRRLQPPTLVTIRQAGRFQLDDTPSEELWDA